MYLNKAFIIGNLTRDPELKSLPSGVKVTSFSVATNRVYTQNGEKKENTEFHNVVVFGKQAETVSEWMKKGSQILVEGRIQTRTWEHEGKKNYRTEIIADAIQFGSRPKSEQGEMPAPAKREPTKVPNTDVDYPEDDINPDDIPF